MALGAYLEEVGGYSDLGEWGSFGDRSKGLQGMLQGDAAGWGCLVADHLAVDPQQAVSRVLGRGLLLGMPVCEAGRCVHRHEWGSARM